MTAAMVEVTNLKMKRGDFVLDMPSWQVRQGEVIGLVGPNGAGKTTLLQLLHGIYPPDEGTVEVFGYNPWRHPVEVRLRAGYASEDVDLFPLRAKALFRTLKRYYPDHWDDALHERLLDHFQIEPDWSTGSLSRGQEVRLRLVAAMSFAPDLLILDEPMAGLDLGHKQRLLESVLEVVRGGERSVIISSHNLHEVERVSDRLLVLGEGRIAGDGTTDSLVGDTRTLEEAMVAWGVAG